MNRIITYAVERDSGIVVSRVGSHVAVPVLDFEAIGKGGDGFEPGDFNGPVRWNLETFDLYALQPWQAYRWTKKIPIELKNRHREYWGFPPIKATDA